MELESPKSKEQKGNILVVPVSIIIAGALIAAALYFKDTTTNEPPTQQAQQKALQTVKNLDAVSPVTDKDHIRGSVNAPVVIVEYSDTECPFCKRFHTTMQKVTQTYGDKVAWVYRHYPLERLHSKAPKEAEATECAAELGGNDKYWAFLDRLFEVTPANDGLDLDELPKIAVEVGIDEMAFKQCLSSGRHAQTVQNHLENAMATGGNGTPWSIVIGKDGKKYSLSGAQPESAIGRIIDLAIEGK